MKLEENPTEESANLAHQERDVSGRYDDTASGFDLEVKNNERTSLIWLMRRRLVGQAEGHVLESSAGTGRNHSYYNLDKCKSITFVDQSALMVVVAMQKWREIYSKPLPTTQLAFKQKSALELKEKPKDGYDTIVQTMGICSTPVPAETLAHLGTLLNQKTGKMLLIEHRRGYYEWTNKNLDRTAPRHAEQFGCYYNRDIQKILEESGLVIEKIQRPYWWNLGTVWVVEARPKGWTEMKKWTR